MESASFASVLIKSNILFVSHLTMPSPILERPSENLEIKMCAVLALKSIFKASDPTALLPK